MQLNSTYHKAIKAIPYEVVYNRKPNYKRTPVGLRQITMDEVEEQEIDDEMDISLIRDGVAQEEMEQRVQLQLDASNIADDPDYQEHVTNKLNYDSNRMLEEEEAAAAVREDSSPNTADPVTPPNSRQEEGLPVDPDLLSPRLDRLRLAQPKSQELDSTPTTALRQQIQINQKHANERSQRQYDKQRQVRRFALFDQVSVAVPALDRASTDNKRIFERVIELNPEYNSYQILTKYEVLDRNYPTSELNPLPSQFDLEISDPPPTAEVTLHYYAAQESTSEKIPVHCNCRDQKTWCSTRRYACVKAETKCSIACHGGTNQDSTPDYSNISTMAMRTQREHRTRDQVQIKKTKRQRRDKAGQWIASKGNDMINDNEGSSSRQGRRGHR